MADFLNAPTLGIFPFYIIPGIIATFVYNFFIRSDQRKYSDYIVELITFGIFYQGTFFWLVAIVNRSDVKSNLFLYNFLMIITVFVIPGILGYTGAFITKSRKLRNFLKTTSHPTTMAWDYVFGKNEPYYILFHLKSGQKLCGLYSGESFVSSYPRVQEIYVQQLHQVSDTGVLGDKIERSAGAIIKVDECSYIEFFTA